MFFGAAAVISTLGGRLFSGAFVSHCCAGPCSHDEQPRVGTWLAKGRALLITVGVTLCPAAMCWVGRARFPHLPPAPSPPPSRCPHKPFHRASSAIKHVF